MSNSKRKTNKKTILTFEYQISKFQKNYTLLLSRETFFGGRKLTWKKERANSRVDNVKNSDIDSDKKLIVISRVKLNVLF